MKRDKTYTRLRWLIIPLLVGLVGFVSAKYIMTIEKEYTVTFTADLANSFVLQEHKAIRADDGTYTLSETETTTSRQEYLLIPGLDIEKDPHIVITQKTDVPAYLYIEIVENLDTVKVDETDVNLITYDLTTNWMSLPPDWNPSNPVNPKYGGTIYIYKGDSNTPVKLVKDSTNPSAPTNYTIPILKDDKVYVSQHIKHSDTNGISDLLTFYAYLVEAVD